jgi:hypothetical protein
MFPPRFIPGAVEFDRSTAATPHAAAWPNARLSKYVRLCAATGGPDEPGHDDGAAGGSDELGHDDGATGGSDEPGHDDSATGGLDEPGHDDIATGCPDEPGHDDSARVEANDTWY